MLGLADSTGCPDPYDLSPSAPAPRSGHEVQEFYDEAYAARQERAEQKITVLWIAAPQWVKRGTDFSVTADINRLVSAYGPGVYTVLLWPELDGEDVPISEYSVFY